MNGTYLETELIVLRNSKALSIRWFIPDFSYGRRKV